jgi:hypothetical protein
VKGAQGKGGAQSGFTLVELAVTSTLLTGAMAMIAMCADTATRSLGADDLVAKAMETLQRNAVRISSVLRPCSLATYQQFSTQADVPVYATAAGQWIEPVDGEACSQIQFRAAAGTESMNAARLTGMRGLHLQLARGETRNNRDDNGNGLIDEGDVILEYDGISVRVASNIESITFTLTNRLLQIELHSGARRRDGSVQRFTVHETLYLRNN